MILDLSAMEDTPYNRMLATILHSAEDAESGGAFKLLIKAHKYTDEEYYDSLICSVLQELHIYLYILKNLKLETPEAIYLYLEDHDDPVQLPKPDFMITMAPSMEMQKEDCSIVVTYEQMPMETRCRQASERLLAYMQLTGYQEYIKYQTQRFFASISLDTQTYTNKKVKRIVEDIMQTKEMAAKESSSDVLVQKVLHHLQARSIPVNDKMS